MSDEESAFKRDVLPVIGEKYLDEVSPEDIDTIQRNILNRAKAKNKKNQNVARRSGKSSAKHTLSYTRQFFELAKKKRAALTTNPVDEVEPLGSSSVRERILDFREIWLFWNGIEGAGCPPVMAYALKFLLATMQRSKEVRNMRYSSYRQEEHTWHMQTGETKNRRMHRVPLNKYARDLIERVKPFTGESVYVFGATRALRVPEEPSVELQQFGKSAFAQALKRNREVLGIEDFAPHDFRRTGATWITAVGLPKMYASLLLNHTDGSSDVTSQVYVQYSYDFEKRRAMDVWEFVLDQIVTCKSVEDVPDLETIRKKVAESGLLRA